MKHFHYFRKQNKVIIIIINLLSNPLTSSPPHYSSFTILPISINNSTSHHHFCTFNITVDTTISHHYHQLQDGRHHNISLSLSCFDRYVQAIAFALTYKKARIYTNRKSTLSRHSSLASYLRHKVLQTPVCCNMTSMAMARYLYVPKYFTDPAFNY